MTIRTKALLTAAAVLSLGAAACTEAEQENTEAQAEAAAEGRPGAVNPNTDQRVPADN